MQVSLGQKAWVRRCSWRALSGGLKEIVHKLMISIYNALDSGFRTTHDSKDPSDLDGFYTNNLADLLELGGIS